MGKVHSPAESEANDQALAQKKSDHKYTYKEYSTWPDDERWELIDGVAYNMSPAPTSRHQRISLELSRKLGNFFENKKCSVYAAPFDVFLPIFPIESEDSIDTVVQPDISVICDLSKIIEKGCMGAPDLIVEILSPSTSKRDLNEKFGLYERSGVKEYWTVDPGNKYIRVFHLQTKGEESGKYDEGTLIPPTTWGEENTLAESLVLVGFKVDIERLFN